MKRRLSWPALFLCLLFGLALGAAVFTFYYARGHAYLSDSPSACIQCHVMREHYDSWGKASHHTVATCNDCHLSNDSFFDKWFSKTRNGILHSRAFTFQDFAEPIRIHDFNRAVVQNNCIRCHQALVSEIPDHARLDCVRCHQGVGHGPTR
ncbi:MAG: cytochrome c nitrite reductase small subunit [Gemmataceae bacterium]|nr:cytochrome c nitrite reductase small subunit [Gemmataceae bacterium]MCI0740146.1 cytochrome c nitrite reductase small subunit [Gemmataceae bacterium]